MTLASLRNRLAKPASLIEVGGTRQPADPTVSWFGAVHLGAAGEEWPRWQGVPMAPIAQLNVRDAPFVPTALDDVALLTVFAANVPLNGGEANGEGWLVRAYPALDDLVPLAMPPEAHVTLTEIGCERPLKALPIRYSLLAADFPDWPDVPDDVAVSAEIEDEWEAHFVAHDGLKLGGWPALLQDRIFWAPFNEHPSNPEYVFQIAAVPQAGFELFGEGIWYFGRGTGDARDVWAFEYQMR
ncbi:MAG: hypothetical protein JWN27_1915 [Candidatus Eremiobacteraeota bacterium]|nr:hypothetical protein [Candidatus Eremiobacteraeota bacterium]